MRADLAIIGGTGVGSRLSAAGGEALFVPTRYGVVKGRVVTLGGQRVYCVSRHSANHSVPPHAVNYRAMACGLKMLGVGACLSTAAVGSLRSDWPKGFLAVCSDFLDVSGRNRTRFADTVVHRDFLHPFDAGAKNALIEAAKAIGEPAAGEGVYVNVNGPRFETPAEIEAYRRLGGDIVGMTAGSEAVAMREAEVPYACLAVVTNLAAGMEPVELAHGEVSGVMQERGQRIVELLTVAAQELASK